MATGEEARRRFLHQGVCVCRGVLFNSLARLRKEENLNLTSVPSPELKKKSSIIRLHIFRKKLIILHVCLNAPFDSTRREWLSCDRISVVTSDTWFSLQGAGQTLIWTVLIPMVRQVFREEHSRYILMNADSDRYICLLTHSFQLRKPYFMQITF